MNTSSHTGRASRTMKERFGPYTSNSLHPMPDRAADTDYSLAWWAAMVVITIASAVIVWVLR